MAESAFRAEFDARQLAGFLKALKAFEPDLATATRRNLRRTGVETIADMRSVVGSGGPARAGISAGLKTAVATGKRSQGVKIQGTAARIADGHKPMLRLWNKSSFRHPVFGTGKWVMQSGRPYFGSTIKRHEDSMVEAIMQALEEAFEKMAATK